MTPTLHGRTVVVTRDEDDDGPLGRALSALGATVRRVPCVETAPPEDPLALTREWSAAHRFDWLFVTSVRAAAAVAEAAARTPPHLPERRPVRVAAVGARTAEALRDAGFPPDVTGEAGAAALVAAMGEAGPLSGARVLFPASNRAREEGPAALAEAGADVTKVIAYRILARAGARPELRSLCSDPAVHALTFTSPSAAEVLGPPPGAPTGRIAAIGRTTAAALADLGWTDLVVAPQPDFPSLARALAEALHAEET